MIDPPAKAKYFGKYRGVVKNNQDSVEKLGRLEVSVPSLYGDQALKNWAMPCTPYAGPSQGLFLIPPVEAKVWVEFEGGDLEKPIWSGCFWGAGECPEHRPELKILKTPAATITLDESNREARLTIETAAGHRIRITAKSLILESQSGARIELAEAKKITLNDGALEVT